MSGDDTSLIELFARMDAPSRSASDANRYTAAVIPSWEKYRLGKDPSGSPALLIQLPPDRSRGAPPIRLQHLSVAHDVDCVVYRDQARESGRFSVISCLEADRATETYFLRIIEALLPTIGECPDPRSINQAVDRFVELFQALRNPPIKTAQGLWAELLLIAESQNPVKLIDAWHSVPDDLYDFNDGHHRIEVKSTRGEARRHHFSLAQLQPLAETVLVIVSVIVNRAGAGTTINELVDELHSQLAGSPDRLFRLYKVVALTLGDSWRESTLEMFDRAAAKRSLALFKPSDVPMVSPNLPPGVSNVHFTSDLTGKPTYTTQEARALGGLIASVVPRSGRWEDDTRMRR